MIYRSYLWGLSLAMLASGCCLPQLGGRYTDKCAPQVAGPKAGTDCPGGEQPQRASTHGHAKLGHAGRGRLHAWLASHADDPGTPLGEVIPVPRFHPVPVRPVFEPQFDYALPQSLESHLAPVVPAPGDDGLPTPAKPIADPA